MNLYQDKQLSFSRFASIDASDYTEGSDYILDAIVENVSRMIQFQKNRSTEPINHIVFYGETSERFRELADEMEQMGLTASVISVPPLITGYEKLEFSNYANAIGAMFKRDKETEKINLLELGGTAGMITDKVSNDNSFKVIAGVSVCAVVVVFAILGIALNIYNASIVGKIDDANEFINSPDTIAQLEEYDNRTAMLENVRTYKDAAKLASDAYDSQPFLGSDLLSTIEDTAKSVDSSISFDTISYDAGVVNIPVTAKGKNDEYCQSLPSSLVQALLETDAFYNVDYTGYTASDTVTEKNVVDEEGNVVSSSKSSEKSISFNLVMYVKSESDNIAKEYDSSQNAESVDLEADGEESDE
jgi:type IV pilus assembly protein PilM